MCGGHWFLIKFYDWQRSSKLLAFRPQETVLILFVHLFLLGRVTSFSCKAILPWFSKTPLNIGHVQISHFIKKKFQLLANLTPSTPNLKKKKAFISATNHFQFWVALNPATWTTCVGNISAQVIWTSHWRYPKHRRWTHCWNSWIRCGPSSSWL